MDMENNSMSNNNVHSSDYMNSQQYNNQNNYQNNHIPNIQPEIIETKQKKNNNSHLSTIVITALVTTVIISLLMIILSISGFYFFGNHKVNYTEPVVNAQIPTPPTTNPLSKTPENNSSTDSNNSRNIENHINPVEIHPTSSSDYEKQIEDSIEKTIPAIVSIKGNYTESIQDIFGRTYQHESQGAGSGIIISENNEELFIVTNQHITSGASTLKITFSDESEVEASLKGEDAEHDVAVIAVKKSDLKDDTIKNIKIAKLGDSTQLRIGQTVLAIGNALGYGQSVTSGIVGATRDVTLENGTHKLIQTDAAINPGNSGGALIDIYGNVVGINEAKLVSSYIEGMGYAIPISEVQDIINGFLSQETKQKVEGNHGILGISGADIDKNTSEQYNMPMGIYIATIEPNMAADNAGIKKGTIITKLDGQSVQTITQLKNLLEYYKAGQEVEITVYEPIEDNFGYNEKTYKVTLSEQKIDDDNNDSETEQENQVNDINQFFGNDFGGFAFP